MSIRVKKEQLQLGRKVLWQWLCDGSLQEPFPHAEVSGPIMRHQIWHITRLWVLRERCFWDALVDESRSHRFAGEIADRGAQECPNVGVHPAWLLHGDHYIVRRENCRSVVIGKQLDMDEIPPWCTKVRITKENCLAERAAARIVRSGSRRRECEFGTVRRGEHSDVWILWPGDRQETRAVGRDTGELGNAGEGQRFGSMVRDRD